MKISKGLILLLSSMSLSVSCTHTPSHPEAPREPAQEAELPDAKNWEPMKQFVQNLDLSRPEVSLSPSTGGSSVYAIVSWNGKAIGALLPENAATVLSGEILAFHLARAFHVETIYQPGVYHFLTGKNLAIFRQLVERTPTKTKLKADNKAKVLARIANNPGGIPTAFKEFGNKPIDYDSLVSVSANTLNKSHILKGSSTPVSQFLSCTGPQPNQNVSVTVNGGKTNELFASMQLSTIFLIDALTQQWDRFSGGNLQSILTKEGQAKFVAYDNGGTWGGPRWTEKYLALLTRFDVNVANEILAMNEFFASGTPYQGLRNEAEFAKALGIEKFPEALRNLKKSLPIVSAHLRKYSTCTFPAPK